jgi:hypothetical protein
MSKRPTPEEIANALTIALGNLKRADAGGDAAAAASGAGAPPRRRLRKKTRDSGFAPPELPPDHADSDESLGPPPLPPMDLPPFPPLTPPGGPAAEDDVPEPPSPEDQDRWFIDHAPAPHRLRRRPAPPEDVSDAEREFIAAVDDAVDEVSITLNLAKIAWVATLDECEHSSPNASLDWRRVLMHANCTDEAS